MDEKPVGKWSFHVTALQEIAETKPEKNKVLILFNLMPPRKYLGITTT